MNTYLIGYLHPDDYIIHPLAILVRPAGMSQPDFAALVQLATESLPMADHLEPGFNTEAIEVGEDIEGLILTYCPVCETVQPNVSNRDVGTNYHLKHRNTPYCCRPCAEKLCHEYASL